MVVQISKKRKFVVDGIFRAKLNEFSLRGLLKWLLWSWDLNYTNWDRNHYFGLQGAEYSWWEGPVDLGLDQCSSEVWLPWGLCRALCWKGGHKRSVCHCTETLHYKLLGGLAVWRACFGVLQLIMKCGAKSYTPHPTPAPRNLLGRITRYIRRLWVWWICLLLIVVIVHRCILTPKFIKLYTLNMSSLLYIIIPLSSWTELCSL